mmetsp:Transcript_119610/g.338573  ORF Transcript_119610/g.338573 Transcript_119610/m.338573 type:complete len:324 (-) Transcript_119610:354-1325(-)
MLRLGPRALTPGRLWHPFGLVSRPAQSGVDCALTADENAAWSKQTSVLAQDHPRLVKEMLGALDGGPGKDPREIIHVVTGARRVPRVTDLESPAEGKASPLFCKAANAKMMRGLGQGKTMLFAYLSKKDKRRVLQLTKAEGAEAVIKRGHGKTAFFASLPGEIKYNALIAWQREREGGDTTLGTVAPPTNSQLLRLAVLVGIPMVGFGFVDNFLMICFGDAIEITFGRMFGWSTMAAAGFGNLLSDAAGIGLADYIENAAERLGLPQPSLSPQQRQMRSARVANMVGAVGGVSIGCLLGMCPLLFISTEHNGQPQKGDMDVQS